jgi:hypothetical protein
MRSWKTMDQDTLFCRIEYRLRIMKMSASGLIFKISIIVEYFIDVICGIGNVLNELILTQYSLAYFMLMFTFRSDS